MSSNCWTTPFEAIRDVSFFYDVSGVDVDNDNDNDDDDDVDNDDHDEPKSRVDNDSHLMLPKLSSCWFLSVKLISGWLA